MKTFNSKKNNNNNMNKHSPKPRLKQKHPPCHWREVAYQKPSLLESMPCAPTCPGWPTIQNARELCFEVKGMPFIHKVVDFTLLYLAPIN